MIAADTSTWVAFLEGGAGEDAQLLDKRWRPASGYGARCAHRAPKRTEAPFRRCRNAIRSTVVEIASGYWQRAGGLRAKVLASGARRVSATH